MTAKIDEIADGIFRLSVFSPATAPPHGMTFNHFLIRGEEPMLFHCGKRKMFPVLAEAMATIMPVEKLRWMSFGHFEADECGGMNDWLAVAPHAELMHGVVGCRTSIGDMADRAPRMLTNNQVIDIGGKRIRYMDTPHVPHGWDAGTIFEETTKTLFVGDLFGHLGQAEALTNTDILGRAMTGIETTYSTSLVPTTAPTIRKFGELKPETLAVMHGSSYAGDCVGQLNGLADAYEGRLQALLDAR